MCRALVLGFGLTLVGCGAFARARTLLEFTIAAQPLAVALDAYSAASGFELYYDGELAIGRHSSAVEGLLAPDVALRELLVGSGLVARATGPNSFTIAPISSSRAANSAYQSYFAALQIRVSQVLCASPDTRPGNTDLLIQLWIAAAGTVLRAQLLDADDGAHESAFAAGLRGLQIGAVPPAGLPQPITMAILARGKGEPSGCAGSAER